MSLVLERDGGDSVRPPVIPDTVSLVLEREGDDSVIPTVIPDTVDSLSDVQQLYRTRRTA